MLRSLSTLILRNQRSITNVKFSRTVATMKGKKWVLVRNFQGEPKDGDAAIREETLPELTNGDVLLEAQWWSVDPYMRPRTDMMEPGSTLPGEFVAKVVESKNAKYPVGTNVVAGFGWKTHVVCNPDTLKPGRYFAERVPLIRPTPNTDNFNSSVNLGVLGVPGLTAYFGFLELCQPKPGETVLVNGAAGAVGSLVGQIAKIKGCKVIGFAGTEEKVRYIKEELGFDYAYNYKTTDVSTALAEAAPKGVDCYFDNVGGDFSTRVITQHMRDYGRISCCGSISRYNDMADLKLAPEIFPVLLFRQLKLEGFIVFRWLDRFPEAYTDLIQWINEGKLKFREHVSDGFENMYPAFQGLLKGDNIGKAVIRSTDVTPVQSKL